MTAIPGFAPTIGPVQDIAPGQVSLILAQQHLNYANRMHGAMMMLLLANAAHSQARHAMQQRPDAGQAIELAGQRLFDPVQQRGK